MLGCSRCELCCKVPFDANAASSDNFSDGVFRRIAMNAELCVLGTLTHEGDVVFNLFDSLCNPVVLFDGVS